MLKTKIALPLIIAAALGISGVAFAADTTPAPSNGQTASSDTATPTHVKKAKKHKKAKKKSASSAQSSGN